MKIVERIKPLLSRIKLSALPAKYKKALLIAVFAYLAIVLGLFLAFKPSGTVQKLPEVLLKITNIEQYATDKTAPSGDKYIAIIISNMGMSEAKTNDVLKKTPPEVALAFSAYSPNMQQWLSEAAKYKHEALILLPMESASYPFDDPGPKTLSLRVGDAVNEQLVSDMIKENKGAIGFVNFMGSQFLNQGNRLEPVFAKMKDAGYKFIENYTGNDSKAAAIAQQVGLGYVPVNLQIDKNPNEDAILKKLINLEQIALKQGYAVGIAEPYGITISTINNWLPRLKKLGIKLATLQTMWKNVPQHDR